MQIINNHYLDFENNGLYIALGSFDGLHKGHLSLINKVKEFAKENNGLAAVFTFIKHPLEQICKEKSPQLIMDNEYKIKILEEEGIDIVIMREFDNEFMKKTPEDFINMLVNQYNVKGIVVGFNYKFGYKNIGNTDLLRRYSEIYGYKLEVIEPCIYDKEVISSTRIRGALNSGDVGLARMLLNRPYSVEGTVIHGKKLGRTIGFPTANIEINKKILIPLKGVYYTNVLYNNKIYRAITSIGHNPTVNGEKLTIEPYILDFNKEIYGEKIRVFFIERMRDEMKFPSINELIEQLKYDAKLAENKELIT